MYNLGVLPETDPVEEGTPVPDADNATLRNDSNSSGAVPWPPSTPVDKGDTKWYAPPMSRHLHLPLPTLTVEAPRPTWARAARIKNTKGRNLAAELVNDFHIGVQDMMMVYMSPDPYHDAFEQSVDLRKFLSVPTSAKRK